MYLHLDSPKLSFWDKAPRVDYLGTTLIGGSALMFLLALNWAGASFGWGSGRVVGLLVASGVILIPFWLYVHILIHLMVVLNAGQRSQSCRYDYLPIGLILQLILSDCVTGT
jgi:hypothetical protein